MLHVKTHLPRGDARAVEDHPTGQCRPPTGLHLRWLNTLRRALPPCTAQGEDQVRLPEDPGRVRVAGNHSLKSIIKSIIKISLVFSHTLSREKENNVQHYSLKVVD